jgi:hypothetical protein
MGPSLQKNDLLTPAIRQRANAIPIQFTAIIVSGATSDAELLL